MNMDNHQSCMSCNRRVQKGNGRYSIDSYRKGKLIRTPAMEENVVFFVLEGVVSAACGSFDNVSFKKDELGFFPKHIDRHLLAKEDCTLVTMAMPNFGSTCGNLIFFRFYEQARTVEWEFKPLKMNRQVHLYIQLLGCYMSKKLICSLLHKCKEIELVLLLKRTYRIEDVIQLIQPIIGHEQKFRDFVLDNYRHVSSVSEFASRAAMNVTSFALKFKEEFGLTPLEWMHKKKAEALLYRIKHTDYNMDELIYSLHFSSRSDIIKFSQRQWGYSPLALIDKLRKQQSHEDSEADNR